MRRVLAAATTVLVMLVIAGGASAVEGSRYEEVVRSGGGVISSESTAASEAGLQVLDAGGNAMDAAVTTAFALGITRPQSCGVGGGGFLVYRDASGETAALDFRETAPAAITPETFGGQGLHKIFTGHTTVGVPGTVAGMQAALESYGTISLADAIAPAEQLAREGFEVPESLSEEMGNHVSRLKLFPETREQFLVSGEEPYPPGSTLVQPELAETLDLIAREGPDAFYNGEIADRIAEDMQNAGDLQGDEGLMTGEDLAGYRAVWREPLVGDYRGREILAMPPPTSGGIAVIEMLNILEDFDLAAEGQSSAEALHLLAEAQKLAFADRDERVADPDFEDVPTEELTDEAYAESRRAEINPEKAGSYRPGDLGEAETSSGSGEDSGGSTTHLSVIDAAGNAVALTCTIEQTFGSAVVPPGTGILLNNELTDFGEPGSANEPEGGKRPRSSISPTIVVEDGIPVLVVGAAGGAQIIMGSLLAVVNTVDYGLDPARAIDAERIDEPAGTKMTIEQGRVTPQAQAGLAVRGHEIKSGKERQGEYAKLPRVQAAGVDPETGERLAATDPRSNEPAASVGQGAGAARQGTPQKTRQKLPGTGGPPLACFVRSLWPGRYAPCE
ncbi:MAG TPA: gamma-glutamyltransferase [Rubrobacteraceae bacterium]